MFVVILDEEGKSIGCFWSRSLDPFPRGFGRCWSFLIEKELELAFALSTSKTIGIQRLGVSIDLEWHGVIDDKMDGKLK